MSDGRFPSTAAPSRVGEIKLRAAAWLEQRDGGGWIREDQAQFLDWVNASADNRVEFLRIQAAWDRTERLAVLRTPQLKQTPEREGRGGVQRFLRLTAALVLFAAIGVGAALHLRTPHYTTYQTLIGGRKTLALSDGSKIELNTDTQIRVDDGAGNRQILLDRGEAFFDVVHDTAHPFVVIAGNGRITDLGTKFLVRRDPVRLEVALTEGRASFETGEQSQPRSITLVPGDVVIATAKSVSVTRKSASALSNVLGWRRGVLVFENATLAGAATELNRYSRDKLVVDSAAANVTFGATVPTGDISAFTEVAQEVLGLHVKKHGNEIVISR